MLDFHNPLTGLSRPRLMVSAVRHGLANYARDRILGRTFGHSVPAPGHALVKALVRVEADYETRRGAASADYIAAEHVEILIALVAESRALADSMRSTPNANQVSSTPARDVRPAR